MDSGKVVSVGAVVVVVRRGRRPPVCGLLRIFGRVIHSLFGVLLALEELMHNALGFPGGAVEEGHGDVEDVYRALAPVGFAGLEGDLVVAGMSIRNGTGRRDESNAGPSS